MVIFRDDDGYSRAEFLDIYLIFISGYLHMYVFYVNIKICIYYIILKKSKYSTNIFI
jgi:hypothetical protein